MDGMIIVMCWNNSGEKKARNCVMDVLQIRCVFGGGFDIQMVSVA